MSRKSLNMATARLMQDYQRIMKDPVPYVKAHPLQSNILEWHYAVLGPPDTPYEGGVYHGKLVFPTEFPFKPPSIYIITPNGRFKVNVRLCLSISDFHPDSWNPAWSVSTILTGLLSFMLEKNATLGSIDTTDYEKRQLALKSLSFNLKDLTFCDLFPDLVEECQQRLAEMNKKAADSANSDQSKQNHSGSSSSGRSPNGGQAGGSAISNVVIFLGFAAFAYTVNWVLTTT